MEQRRIKQKNIKRATAIAVLACSLSGNAHATDRATLTITGRVVSTTCTIDSASATQRITLANIADSDIKGAGKTGGERNISIILKGCGEAAGNVVVTASGTRDADDSTAFANTATTGAGGAGGVGLYFYQTNGTTKFKPDGSVTETSKLTPSADNTLTYKASYVATKDTVKAGRFTTIVNMRFDYQ